MDHRIKKYALNFGFVFAAFIIIQIALSTGIINNYYRGIIITICINIILATSLNLVTGYLGQLTLGHAGFMSVGAYASGMLTLFMVNISNGSVIIGGPLQGVAGFLCSTPLLLLLLSLIIGGLMAAVFGFIIGIPVLRLRGDYLAIITLAFGEIIRVIILNIDNITGKTLTMGASGLKPIPNYTEFYNVYWIMAVCVLFLYLLVDSRQGRSIISIREDEIAAEASGIPTTYYKMLAFVLAAFFAGIAGGFYAHYISVLNPGKFDYNYSIEILVIVVLGGLGKFRGVIIAAIVLTILPEMLRVLETYRMVIYPLILILIMVARNSPVVPELINKMKLKKPTLLNKKG